MNDAARVNPALLDVRNQKVVLRGARGELTAVNDVSYSLSHGETLAVVGESGSGKSMQYLTMLGLVPTPPAHVRGGTATFLGKDLFRLSAAERRGVLGKEIGVVFQDPMSSLNPVLTVGLQIIERVTEHLHLGARQARALAIDLLATVGIPDPRIRVDHYPHQFSGGMRQRVMIAIALSCEPRLLIADEPTTALDVTVQAQIIELVQKLKSERRMSVIWISHDLGVVAGIADTVQVMYAGSIVERGPVSDIFRDPRSAYTVGLLSSLPTFTGTSQDRLQPIPGSPPDLWDLPAGDPFAPRNPHATERCFRERPSLLPVEDGHPDHLVAAWYDLRKVARCVRSTSTAMSSTTHD